MRLSDIISHLHLTTYPIAALVIFLGVFAMIASRVLSRRHAPEYRRAALLPLVDDAPTLPDGPRAGRTQGARS